VIGVDRGLDWGLEDLREWMGVPGSVSSHLGGQRVWRTYGRLAWKVALVEAARHDVRDLKKGQKKIKL
jgi:hypothetical protein